MAKTPKATLPKAGENPGRIIDIDVASEMSESFLEYAYSVIYSRALPDARDGLKPVQRRILDPELRRRRSKCAHGPVPQRRLHRSRGRGRPRELHRASLFDWSDQAHQC